MHAIPTGPNPCNPVSTLLTKDRIKTICRRTAGGPSLSAPQAAQLVNMIPAVAAIL